MQMTCRRASNKMKNAVRCFLIFTILVNGILVVPVCNYQLDPSVENKPKGYTSTSQAQNESILPYSSFTILLSDWLLGQVVNATLTFEFNYFLPPPDGDISIGFRQEFLLVKNVFGFSAILGIGWGEMREYPFLYYSDGTYSDYWVNRTPGWTSWRPRPAWTTTFRFGLYTSHTPNDRPPYNASDVVFAGDILEFENLTIYFADGTSFLCGPRLITIGANFTQTEEGWTTESIVTITDDYPVTVEGTIIKMTLSRFVPLALLTVGLIGSVVAVFVMVFYWVRKIDKKMHEEPAHHDSEASRSGIALG